MTPERIKRFAIALFAFSALFSVTAVEGAMLLLAGAVVFERLRGGDLPLLLKETAARPLFRPWMLYLAAGLFTAAFALNKGKAFAYAPSDMIKYLCFISLAAGLAEEELPLMSNFYMFAAAAAAAVGISQSAWALHSGLDLRAHAFVHPVRFGEMMVIAVWLPLGVLLTERPGLRRGPAVAACLLIFSALVLSQTRGAYLGFCASFAAVFLLDSASRKKSAVIFGALIFAGLIAVIALPQVRYRLSSISKGVSKAAAALTRDSSGTTVHTDDLAINIRIELWKTALRIFRDHPLTGIGPNNMRKVFPAYYKGPLGNQDSWGSIHNLYLHHLAERGLLGLAALLTLFGGMFALALKNFRRERNPWTLWALAVLPAFFVVNLTEISFQHIHTSFAVFLALAASCSSVAAKLPHTAK
ncbi:MAG: O-antigen ligase family protein [Elusimicrobiales bacterium]|jgi:O-antigen ligase